MRLQKTAVSRHSPCSPSPRTPHCPPVQASNSSRRRCPSCSAVTLVPIDVRVIENKTGKAVTDMRQEEFTLTEDGVRQELRHLSLLTLATAAPEADAKLTL